MKLEYNGYPVEVEYEVMDDSIDVLFWQFESEDAIEVLNLYSEFALSSFEADLAQMIGEKIEAQKKAYEQWIRPLYAMKRMRNMYN